MLGAALAAGWVALLAVGCRPKPPQPIQDEPAVYPVVDDPLQVRVAAGSLANGHSNDAPASVPSTTQPSAPSATIRGARLHANESPAPQRTDAVGTVDEFIASRMARLYGLTQQRPPAERIGPEAADQAGTPGTESDALTGARISQGHPPQSPSPPPAAPAVVNPSPTEGAASPWPPAPASMGPAPHRLVLPQPGAGGPPPPPLPSGRLPASPAAAPSAPSRGAPGARRTLPGASGAQSPPAKALAAHELADAAPSGAAIQVMGRVFLADDILQSVWSDLDRLAARLSPTTYRREAMELIGNQLRAEVSEHLVLREAERSMNEQAREAVDKTLAEMLREQVNKLFGGSERLMRQVLTQRGVNFEEERDRQRRQLLVQAYLRERFLPQIHVTRPEAYAYYEKHLDEFSDEPKVHIKLIQIKPDRWYPNEGPVTRKDRLDAEAQARTHARKILSQVRTGAISFEQAAARYSDGPYASSGGDWGFIRRGGLRARKVADAAFKLPVGQVSDVIADRVGQADSFYILKVTETQPLKVVPFSAAVLEIIPKIEKEKFSKTSAAYMLKLYRQADIDEREVSRFIEEAYKVVPKPSGRR